MVFLSYGKRDKVLMKKVHVHIEDDILNHFRGDKCSSLSGKSKIFLFQACRGKKREKAALKGKLKEDVHGDAVKELVAEEGTSQITPAGADFLLCYSASNGYTSYRDIEDGA